jgi:hypothetical protein
MFAMLHAALVKGSKNDRNNPASGLDTSAWLVIVIALLKAAKAIWDDLKDWQCPPGIFTAGFSRNS